jgi:hypothetical protein
MAKKTYGPKPAKPPKQSRGLLSGLWNLIKSAIMLPIALFSAIARRLTRTEDLNKSDADERARNNINKALSHANITNDAVKALIKLKSQDKTYRKEKTDIKKFNMYPPDDLAGFENQDIQYVVEVMLNNKQQYVLGLQYNGTGGYKIVPQNGTPDDIADNLKQQVAQLLKDVSMRPIPENENQPADHDPAPIDTPDEPTPEEPPSSNEEVGKDEQNADMEELKTPTHEPRPDNPLFISYDVEKANGEKKSLLFEYCPVANDMGEHVGGYCQCFVGKPDPQSQVCKPDPQSQPEIWTLLSLDGNTLAGTSTVFGEDGYKFNAGETLKHITTGKYPLEGVILVPSGNCRALVINASDVPAPTVSILQEDEEGKFHLNALKNVKIEDLSKPTVIDALGLSEVSETEKNTPPTAEEARETENNTQHTEEESPEMDDPIGDDGPDL